MMTVLSVLAIALLFGLCIFVHELGHFVAARWLGLVADVFSIGMGPAIWQRRFGATIWKIGWIPFGGYVALPQMAPNSYFEQTAPVKGSAGAESARELPPVAPWRKIVVAVSGALGNVVFAFVLAAVVWWAGKPSSMQEQNAVVGYVAHGSAAEAAGVRAGDEVLALDGRPVATWMELVEAAALARSDEVALRVKTAEGAEREVPLTLDRVAAGIRLLPGVDGMDLCHVVAVSPGSGAEAAGLQSGDQVTHFGGRRVYSRAHLSQLVEEASGAPAGIEFRRGEESLRSVVQSSWNAELERQLIGIQFNTVGDLDYAARVHPTPWAQVRSHSGAIFRFLNALVTPATSGAARDAVGGPILILMMLWHTVRASFVLAVWFTGFLNVNLAIINLLPLPILDGGHVLMNLYEWVTRRPPPARLVNALTHAFFVLFIALFLTLTFRDTVRHVAPGVKQWWSRPAAGE